MFRSSGSKKSIKGLVYRSPREQQSSACCILALTCTGLTSVLPIRDWPPGWGHSTTLHEAIVGLMSHTAAVFNFLKRSTPFCIAVPLIHIPTNRVQTFSFLGTLSAPFSPGLLLLCCWLVQFPVSSGHSLSPV